MAADPNGWLFPSKSSQTGHIPHLSSVFARCVKRAQLNPRNIIPHAMRHSSISRLALLGTDIKTIQEFSGHESLQMVLRYAHAQDRAIDDALERLDGVIPPHKGARIRQSRRTSPKLHQRKARKMPPRPNTPPSH
jgi:integrase